MKKIHQTMLSLTISFSHRLILSNYILPSTQYPRPTERFCRSGGQYQGPDPTFYLSKLFTLHQQPVLNPFNDSHPYISEHKVYEINTFSPGFK